MPVAAAKISALANAARGTAVVRVCSLSPGKLSTASNVTAARGRESGVRVLLYRFNGWCTLAVCVCASCARARVRPPARELACVRRRASHVRVCVQSSNARIRDSLSGWSLCRTSVSAPRSRRARKRFDRTKSASVLKSVTVDGKHVKAVAISPVSDNYC